MQVKADIQGTIVAHTPGGAIFLRAGDDVPDGVNIDPSLVDGKETTNARGAKRRSKAASRPADPK